MDVKEAVDLAKNYVADLFAEEGVTNLGLEEVKYDDRRQEWRITVGFTRTWKREGILGTSVVVNEGKRTYKVVVIDKKGRPVSIVNRDVTDAY